HRTPEGRVVLEGDVIEVVPPRRLRVTFSAAHDAEMRLEPRSRVTWDIEPRGRGSTLTFTHDGFPGESKTYRRALKDWLIVLEGLRRVVEIPFQSICVFCGTCEGNQPSFVKAARSLGQLLAARGIAVVSGGSRLGLMGALADGVLEGGGVIT